MAFLHKGILPTWEPTIWTILLDDGWLIYKHVEQENVFLVHLDLYGWMIGSEPMFDEFISRMVRPSDDNETSLSLAPETGWQITYESADIGGMAFMDDPREGFNKEILFNFCTKGEGSEFWIIHIPA